MLIQYILIAVLVGYAVFAVVRMAKKNFTKTKNSKNSKCEKNCGCS